MRSFKLSIACLAGTTALLAACSGGTPWGATPQNIPIPKIENIPAILDAGTTAGAQRLAERVRARLATEPSLASANLQVEGLESGVIVLSGTPASQADRNLAIQTTKQVPGVRDVVDRMAAN